MVIVPETAWLVLLVSLGGQMKLSETGRDDRVEEWTLLRRLHGVQGALSPVCFNEDFWEGRAQPVGSGRLVLK